MKIWNFFRLLHVEKLLLSLGNASLFPGVGKAPPYSGINRALWRLKKVEKVGNTSWFLIVAALEISFDSLVLHYDVCFFFFSLTKHSRSSSSQPASCSPTQPFIWQSLLQSAIGDLGSNSPSACRMGIILAIKGPCQLIEWQIYWPCRAMLSVLPIKTALCKWERGLKLDSVTECFSQIFHSSASRVHK